MAGIIITIDGPSGAGKSTITRRVAQRLRLRYLDTGAMYRALTLHCMRTGANLDTPDEIITALESVQLRVGLTLEGPMQVFLGDEEVTDQIRGPGVTRAISHIADIREVREFLVEMQRNIGKQGDMITEGRDQGTLVFPKATLKVYMFASPDVRAKRRHAEMTAKGTDISYETVLEDISRRDYLDMGREIGALRKASDAVELDTSEMTPEQVAEAIVSLAKTRLKVKTRQIDKSRITKD
ncbi:(d)CMP kinase [Planctomycetota bacterium]|nr:(d)CMP kinase [Planctomycetota bacterium]